MCRAALEQEESREEDCQCPVWREGLVCFLGAAGPAVRTGRVMGPAPRGQRAACVRREEEPLLLAALPKV